MKSFLLKAWKVCDRYVFCPPTGCLLIGFLVGLPFGGLYLKTAIRAEIEKGGRGMVEVMDRDFFTGFTSAPPVRHPGIPRCWLD